MNVGSVLLHVLVVLVAAKVAAEGAERAGVPAVVGEILAGVVIGPSVLGLVGSDDVVRTLAELGVILLLLQVGLEMDLAELGAVGRAALLVAVIGVVLPFAGGIAVMAAFGAGIDTSIFVGAALTATSVGITARVFGDLRMLASVEARTVLGAAVADDVLGLVILTVVVRIVSGGSVSGATVIGVAGLALTFLVVTTAVGTRLAPLLFSLVQRASRAPGTLVALALAFTLSFAELASAAKLAPIVGAFVAGLSLARCSQAERIQRELTPVGHLFVPVFFLQIGIDADLAALVHPRVLVIAGCLLVVAVVGKLAACMGAAGRAGDKAVIGFGMLPRGEVGLIFAGLGLREGVLGRDLYGALLLVVLATTLAAPPLLGWRIGRVRASRRLSAPVGPRPEGGWLQTQGGIVDVAGEPPGHLALHLGLQAALHAAAARPGPALLDYLSSLGDTPLRWDPAATQELFEVLRRGNTRSWRFLETTGLLDRALPELAEVLRRRRADPFELDPTRRLRWSLVDRVHDVTVDPEGAAEHDRLEHPEWLLLASLILDMAGQHESPVGAARRLVKRLDLGAAAEQEIALLVGESGLLRAAARRPDGLGEERVVQIATHLERAERARALYLLSMALGGLEPWERTRLDELHRLVQAVIARPEVSGREARNLAEQRRAEAVRRSGGGAVAQRLEHAPRSYLLGQDPVSLARQAALLEPLPPRGTARIAVTAGPSPRTWRVEVACRDQRGLLAVVTGAVTDLGLDVA
jgi:Kef-type K+ transport system membrane component KefB